MPGSCPWGHRLRGLGQQRGSWTLRAAASRPQGSRCLWPSSLSPSAVSSPAHGTLPTGSPDFSPKGPRDSSRMCSKGREGLPEDSGRSGWGEAGQLGCGCLQREGAARPRPAPPLRVVRRGHQRAGPPLGTPWRKDGVGEPAGPPLVVPPTCLPHRPAAATPCESPAAVTLSPSRSRRGDIW